MATTEFSAQAVAQLLERASDDVKREVSGFIEQSAITMRDRVQQRYPVGPGTKNRKGGTLRGRVSITAPRGYNTDGSSGVVIPTRQVKASAPHVHMYQEGTRERFDATRKNARRGISPRHGRIMERAAVEVRTEMVGKMQQVADRNRDIG